MAIGRTTAAAAKNGTVKEKPKSIETFSLNAETLAFVKKKAEYEQRPNRKGTSMYFTELLKKYEQYGTVTEGQMEVIENRAKEDAEYEKLADARQKLKDENGVLGPVYNIVKRDGRVVCRASGCREFATVRIDGIGVCAEHIEEGKAINEQYALEHAKA